jgi:N-acyl-D-aspartate/D-glutamate deacylase
LLRSATNFAFEHAALHIGPYAHLYNYDFLSLLAHPIKKDLDFGCRIELLTEHRATDRGLLRAGAWADLAVFDPTRIAHRSTYEDPHRSAVGVSTVVVNGHVTVDGGDHTGALSGRVLRRGA